MGYKVKGIQFHQGKILKKLKALDFQVREGEATESTLPGKSCRESQLRLWKNGQLCIRDRELLFTALL